MTEKPLETVNPLKSSLLEKPEYLQSIALVSVEMANLEIELGSFLASILHIQEKYGHIIFSTPQTAIGRLNIIESVVREHFVKGSDGRKYVQKQLNQVRALIGKRNAIIHSSWAIQEGKVARQELPIFSEGKEKKFVRIEELERTVEDLRDLGKIFQGLTQMSTEAWPPYTWNEKLGPRPAH